MKSVIILLAVVHLIYGATPRVLFSPLLPGQAALEQIPIKPTTQACVDTYMTNCQNHFNSFLGISSDADFHNVEIFVQDINDLIAKGVDDGLLKLCQARSLFYQCLGSRYYSCISREHFLSHGQNLTAATAFVQVFQELEFMCNGGLLQSVQKWDCILKHRQEAEGTLTGCRNAFVNTTIYNPAGMCEAAQGMMICWRMPYYYNCGEDVGWWSCEQGRVALNIDDFCPHLTCSYQTFAPKDGNLAAALPPRPEPVLLSRSELFRSPNPQFMPQEKMQLFIQLGAKAAERAKRKKRSAEDFDEE